MNPEVAQKHTYRWAKRAFFLMLGVMGLLVFLSLGYVWILPGTRVLGIEIGGMSPRGAVAFLRKNLNWDEKSVVLRTLQGSEKVFFGKDLGIYPDIEATVLSTRRFIWLLGRKEFPLLVTVDESVLDSFASRLSERSEAKPEDARFTIDSDGEVKVVPGKAGYAVDVEKFTSLVTKDLRWFELPRQLDVPFAIREPAITESYLSGFLPLEKVASYSTVYQDKNDRAHNVALAAKCFDGLTVWPGQTISFNQVVGPRTKDRGYRKAAVFFGDDVVDDYGGGVCQVSTTLYVSLLKAGFQIMERYNHGMPVNYVPLGLDATVAFDLLDLKMKNPSDIPFVIQSRALDGVLKVSVFGKKETGTEIDVESRVLKEVPSQGKTPESQVGQPGSGETGSSGGTIKLRSGYMVETVRKFIKDGKLIKVEKLNTSWYPPEKPKITTKKGTS